MPSIPRMSLVALAVFLAALGHVVIAEELAKQPLSFEHDIHPILKAHCFYCHGEAGEREGGLDVRLRRWLVKGGESGAALAPGQPDASHLLQRVTAGEMPPGDDKQLSATEIATIRDWIAAGAPTLEPEPESLDEPRFTKAERQWWSLQPVRRPKLPDVPDAASPVDAFVLSRLRTEAVDRNVHDANGADGADSPHEPIGYAPQAAPELLIRRLYLDVLGLPPTAEQVARFVEDFQSGRPGVWERLVDATLASPHYGERWGRHWLDAAGYADSEGYTEADPERPHAFRYRDYVIQAWNRDIGYDQFIREQLAGDELIGWPNAELTPENIRRLAATGFLRMAPDGTAAAGVDVDVARNQTIADTLQVVGVTLMGTSVHCAQCHDHRYDPVPQVDYYRMRAVFEPALNWKQWKNAAATTDLAVHTSATTIAKGNRGSRSRGGRETKRASRLFHRHGAGTGTAA